MLSYKGMTSYELQAVLDTRRWERELLREPRTREWIAKGMQNRFNSMVPDRIHRVITEGVRNMVEAVLTGSRYTTPHPLVGMDLERRERKARQVLERYKTAAVVEGWGTGFGGVVMGMADFPLLLSIKIKFLYEMAAAYGRDCKDPGERLFLLHIFQLAFSTGETRRRLFPLLRHWNRRMEEASSRDFDWRHFQQEYRDYLDLPKLIQMVPVVGAVAGAYVNNRLLGQLGEYAIHCYRLRWMEEREEERE
ncbi:EcsC family protein [Anaerotalea alkaliphila]|uniref:EcsC family protein n=1 Tax=Anaerotalea alkaliphila TaxID=2662126 RepID=A0A7X5HV81_9FIRM|nr:EcsC family protein [Anaerotalea alkaliphila]NDL67106.1 EcsC family protein [Anaerotalea alkaliphila]